MDGLPNTVSRAGTRAWNADRRFSFAGGKKGVSGAGCPNHPRVIALGLRPRPAANVNSHSHPASADAHASADADLHVRAAHSHANSRAAHGYANVNSDAYTHPLLQATLAHYHHIRLVMGSAD